MTTIEDCLKGIESQAKFISALQEDPISANAARVILDHIRRIKELMNDGSS